MHRYPKNEKRNIENCIKSILDQTYSPIEILVVDNNSTDGSYGYLQPKFSEVHFILNKENEGFAKANNKALSVTKGKYILFLNPDTIVAEDSFEKCISFLESNKNAGALGVKMIDGRG